jgi:hypothetical protein
MGAHRSRAMKTLCCAALSLEDPHVKLKHASLRFLRLQSYPFQYPWRPTPKGTDTSCIRQFFSLHFLWPRSTLPLLTPFPFHHHPQAVPRSRSPRSMKAADLTAIVGLTAPAGGVANGEVIYPAAVARQAGISGRTAATAGRTGNTSIIAGQTPTPSRVHVTTPSPRYSSRLRRSYRGPHKKRRD